MNSNDFESWDLLVLFILGALGAVVSFFGIKRQGSTPAPIPVGPSPVQQEAEAGQKAGEQKAQEQRDQTVAQAAKEHDQVVAGQVSTLQSKTEEVRDDVDKTNAVLQDISKQMQ